MGKQTQVLLQFLLTLMVVVAVAMASAISEDPKAVEAWFKRLDRAKEKITKLHFYFHDTYSGKNPTVVTAAQANSSLTSPTFFGMISIIDDPLTVGPEPTSKTLGRAQGLYSTTDQHEVGVLMCMSFVFTQGKYNGSSLSVVGKNSVFHRYREMPIVSGTGVFRLARGIATARTHYFNLTSGDAVVEYNVVIVRY